MRILDAIDRTDDAEVTVECNPDSVDAAKLAAYRRGGVNRLSFGVQSMVAARARRARPHARSRRTSQRAIALARDAGFERINVDLIYGTPGESTDDWRATLDGALALGVDARQRVRADGRARDAARPAGRGRRAPRPTTTCRPTRTSLADELLGAAGLEWYEVSNWARPGEECRHNLLYWSEGEYLGIGCAAHGHTDGRRWWNVRTPERYIAAVEAGTSAEAGAERLEPAAPGRGGLRARAADPARARRSATRRRRVVDELAAAGFAAPGRRPGRAHRLRAGSSRPT